MERVVSLLSTRSFKVPGASASKSQFCTGTSIDLLHVGATCTNNSSSDLEAIMRVDLNFIARSPFPYSGILQCRSRCLICRRWRGRSASIVCTTCGAIVCTSVAGKRLASGWSPLGIGRGVWGVGRNAGVEGASQREGAAGERDGEVGKGNPGGDLAPV
eukprot:Protomagalhaensia_sp_Gyna_25__4973@NODE_542_length_3167_cov_44_113491_g424_i0_p3_GENE_NODE_542_length_3167_cov_44_113491_g424_i0NODE_542_length_3167_cov_44_113491_g424_i0_p3_ORF_typecomplete_len159_score9_68DUF2180/PF09947_9/0_056zfB_box/PF00643_24/0_41_NODE_542_length_3167_cov_44_113491_g424_i07031179